MKQQLAWMEEYQAKYPVLASGNRLLYSSEDTPYDTSFQTYLFGELRTLLGQHSAYVLAVYQ